ncbi:zinc/cadmium resistance protein isoform X2 [Eurytemora carolleeae]|uniref:zinc/cadmium resistance protein isoform X2 n=1 Tax=Eurytemora carolleeae TaxID=1294199 RepID=UPI000C75DB9B|nr:zinc/cadmium resistance protein isoform X2 [Eurytemora carolleeae]|eukprot:XP_023344529.1 zinc/cadmium resistance protein-like isoform X2 [Eurytemora affinis]
MGAGSGSGRGKFSGKKCRLVSMFALTSAFFLVEIVTGYITNSMALVADSFHMLSDIAALVIAFLSVRMAPKSWSKNTFGWARAEVLGALVNAVFLVALCFSITVESFKRFYEPEEIHNPQMILYVGAMGLAVNLIGLCLFHEHGSSHGHSHGLSRSTHSHLTDLADRDEKEEISEIIYPRAEPVSHGHNHGHSHSASNMNMRGVFLHVMADALGSVVVIISALVMWLTDWEYKLYVDPGLSLLLVILILRSVWPLLIDSALILLQTVPTHIQVDNLERKLMEQVDGILAVHEFHVWQLTGDRIIASAHIRCLNLVQYMTVAEKVKEFFHHEGIHSTTIQPEFVETEPNSSTLASSDDCVLSCPKGPITQISGCEASKCCPPPKLPPPPGPVNPPKSSSRQSSPGPGSGSGSKKRRPSSISIIKETNTGLRGLVESPNRRSAPNLCLNDGNDGSPENSCVEMTAELNLSDETQPSSNNSSFRQNMHESGGIQ